MTDLAGKVALVTGGSRGIGAAIARRLAADGADVAITYVSRPDAAEAVVADIRKLGRRAVAIQADSADAAAVAASVDRAAQELGRLDILVNNAGVYETNALPDFSLEQFDRILAINVRAVFAATKAAVRHMQPGGRVISMGSGLAARIPFPGNAVYSMTKAAVGTLMQGLAREYGPQGITFNTVHPGSIDTDMNPAGGDYAQFQVGVAAVGHFGKPEDIADAVAYLANPRAGFTTGAHLYVDGGFTA